MNPRGGLAGQPTVELAAAGRALRSTAAAGRHPEFSPRGARIPQGLDAHPAPETLLALTARRALRQPFQLDAVFDAAAAKGGSEDALHREYFSVPEAPDWVNMGFVLRLARSARTLAVPADRSATDVLNEAGLRIDTQCSDGLCGVCSTPFDVAASGAIEHCDFVLSAAQREQRVILCCLRACDEGGEIVIEL